VQDLETHTKENSKDIRHVAREIELSHKDLAEVLAPLKGRNVLTGVLANEGKEG
jgi:hypothetical protein